MPMTPAEALPQPAGLIPGVHGVRRTCVCPPPCLRPRACSAVPRRPPLLEPPSARGGEGRKEREWRVLLTSRLKAHEGIRLVADHTARAAHDGVGGLSLKQYHGMF